MYVVRVGMGVSELVVVTATNQRNSHSNYRVRVALPSCPQVATACRQVRERTGLRTVCLYGGVPKEPQVRACVVCARLRACARVECGTCVMWDSRQK